MNHPMARARSTGRQDEADERLRRAAFGEDTDVDVARVLSGAARSSPREEWLAAVVLGSRGRYAAATALLEPLCVHRDPVFSSLAASTLASHRRQLGGHAAARALDAAALGRVAPLGHGRSADPDGIDGSGARHDALLGLAADAVGLGRPAEAARLMAAAGRDGAGWRGRVRAGWVGAECRLAAGDPSGAVWHAERAAEDARSVGVPRHVAKSGLVLAAALAAEETQRGRRRAEALITEVLETSLERGFLPLVWPSSLLRAELLPERSDHCLRTAINALNCIYRGSDPVGARLAAASPWMPETLLRSSDRPPANG